MKNLVRGDVPLEAGQVPGLAQSRAYWPNRTRPESDGDVPDASRSSPARLPGPAQPVPLRSWTVSLATCSGIAIGLVFGRRDRGANAASPSARYRATSLLT